MSEHPKIIELKSRAGPVAYYLLDFILSFRLDHHETIEEIDLVQSQLPIIITWDRAAFLYVKHKGDIIEAIMEGYNVRINNML